MGQVTHPQMNGGILCGNTAKRTFTYEGEPTPNRPTADQRIIEAQQHLAQVLAVLRFHEQQEGAPVETNSANGWTEVLTLLLPLAHSLGVTIE